MSGVLGPDQLARFHADGYVPLREAFPREAALDMQDFMWSRLQARCGILRDAPATWRNDVFRLKKTARHRVYQAIASERMCGAIDQLLGEGCWKVPPTWGAFLVSFPEPQRIRWEVTSPPWHWDGDPNRELAGLGGAFVFTLYSEVEPGGGATLVVSGSHRLLVEHYRALPEAERKRHVRYHRKRFKDSHPWLTALAAESKPGADWVRAFMTDGDTIDGTPVRVVELCGGPGDAFLCHPSILHARSANTRELPRFMRAKGIRRRS